MVLAKTLDQSQEEEDNFANIQSEGRLVARCARDSSDFGFTRNCEEYRVARWPWAPEMSTPLFPCVPGILISFSFQLSYKMERLEIRVKKQQISTPFDQKSPLV